MFDAVGRSSGEAVATSRCAQKARVGRIEARVAGERSGEQSRTEALLEGLHRRGGFLRTRIRVHASGEEDRVRERIQCV